MGFVPGKDYVAPDPHGGFDAVVNGVVHQYPDQASAEQNYNTLTGQSNAAPAAGGADPNKTYSTPNGPKTLAEMQNELRAQGWPGDYTNPSAVYSAYHNVTSGLNADGTPIAAGVAAPATGNAAQQLLDAVASGNAQDIQRAVDQFNATLAQNEAEFNANQQDSQRKDYQNLATNLLDTATKLSGPADYYQYERYLQGGRDLTQQLFGGAPNPAFQAPSGTNTPNSLASLMQQMGFTGGNAPAPPAPVGVNPIPGGTPGYNPAGGTAASGATGGAQQYQTVNGPQTLDQIKAQLRGANYGGPWDDASVLAAYGRATKGAVTPLASGGATSGTAPTGQRPPSLMAQATSPPTGAPSAGPGGTGNAAADAFLAQVGKTPAYQVSPANYDALSPSGKAVLQSAIGAAGLNPQDWLAQLDAARPQGTAPKLTQTAYAAPAGAFG